ncbi:MAG TPA: hypothetical protein VHE54_11150 [Puia sp.]|nr:hypothetical protein [Puia sp.]
MNNPSKEIVTISVPKGDLDNDYTFFEDGKIRHNYDQSAYKTGLEAWITANGVPAGDREKILKECPPEFKAKISAILKR